MQHFCCCLILVFIFNVGLHLDCILCLLTCGVYIYFISLQKNIYIYFIFFGWKSSVIFLNELKPNLVIMHLKAILIQIIQTKSNAENHFYINVSKHKSIMFNSLLTKINSIKINSIRINSIRRRIKHILKLPSH
jgi:hypothetical protein